MISRIFTFCLLFAGIIIGLSAKEKDTEIKNLYNIANNAYETLIKIPQTGVENDEGKIANIIETSKKLLRSNNIKEFSLGMLLHDAVTYTLITMFAYEMQYENQKVWPQKSDYPSNDGKTWPRIFSNIPLKKNAFIRLWKMNRLDEVDILKRVLDLGNKNTLVNEFKKYNGINESNSNIDSRKFSIPPQFAVLVNKLKHIFIVDLTKPDLLLLATLTSLQLDRDNDVLIRLYEKGLEVPVNRVKLRKLYENNIVNPIRLDSNYKQPFKAKTRSYQYVFTDLEKYQSLQMLLCFTFYDLLKDKKIFNNKFIEKRRKYFRVLENISQLKKI